jgi:hypothetical protein
MCIDGTYKLEEEKDDQYQVSSGHQHPGAGTRNFDVLKTKFPEIHIINSSLLKKEIPCILI